MDVDVASIQVVMASGHELAQRRGLKPTVHKYGICKFVMDEMAGYLSSTVQNGTETEFCLSYYIVF